MIRDGFASERAERRHRLVFTVLVATLCAISAAVFADASQPLAEVPAFVPSYATAVVVGALVASYLIFVHAALAGRASLLWLGGAYLFMAALTLAELALSPHGWSAMGVSGVASRGAVWLWILRQGGFAALVLVSQAAAAWQRRRASSRPLRLRRGHTVAASTIILAAALELVLLATRWQASLPAAISSGNDFSGLGGTIPGIAVAVLSVAALGAVALGTGGRSVLDLGLILSLLAACADVVLTLRGGTTFSLGWYAGRCADVVAAAAILGAYLHEMAWLHTRVIHLNARLAEQAAMDATTGLNNRRHLNRQLNLALRDARRRGEEVSLVLFDVDHFKLYNERFGHLAGDDCLRRIAGVVASSARRPQDVAARYGGEAFAVLLPGTSIDGAQHVGTTVIEEVRRLAMEHDANRPAGIVTVSAGAATIQPGGRMEDLVRLADRALNAAKEAGGDRFMTQEAILA